MDIEQWRDVAGYRGDYQVSSLGRIKSLKRGRERILRPNTNSGGYRYVVLCLDGQTKTVIVHRIVALAFLPNPDDLPEVNHKDGDKQNCAAQNLEWTSGSGNVRHANSNGLKIVKLTPAMAIEARRRLDAGESQSSVALAYGISQEHAGRIERRENWGYLSDAA